MADSDGDAPPQTTPAEPQSGPRTGGADHQKIPGAPLRVSFAKIFEPLEVPDDLAVGLLDQPSNFQPARPTKQKELSDE